MSRRGARMAVPAVDHVYICVYLLLASHTIAILSLTAGYTSRRMIRPYLSTMTFYSRSREVTTTFLSHQLAKERKEESKQDAPFSFGSLNMLLLPSHDGEIEGYRPTK